MKKVAVLANNDVGLYNFRKELLKKLIDERYEVHLLLPYGERVEKLREMGCVYHEVPIDRRGTDPVKDFRLFLRFRKLLSEIKPDIVLTYTIKPNIYGGLAARMLKLPYVANITGLGSAMEKPGMIQMLAIWLYRIGLKRAQCVFCQNQENLEFIKEKRIAKDNIKLLPGSGVNLQDFSLQEYPDDTSVKFVFIARIMREKGADEYFQAAEIIRKKYPQTEFHICGFCEENYIEKLEKLQNKGIIQYHGMVQNIKEVLKEMHCVVLPSSYHEGMSNVLLEGAATGRPLIATDVPGCRECLRNEISGYLVKPQSVEDLVDKMERFLRISWDNKKKMGLEARDWVEKYFDRQQVINAYMSEIKGETYNGNL